MLSYITSLTPPKNAIKIIYKDLEPTTEYDGIEYIKVNDDLKSICLEEFTDEKKYIAMPVSVCRKVGYIIPEKKGKDLSLIGWAIISEYDAKKTLNLKNQRAFSKVDNSNILSLLFDVLVNTY